MRTRLLEGAWAGTLVLVRKSAQGRVVHDKDGAICPASEEDK